MSPFSRAGVVWVRWPHEALVRACERQVAALLGWHNAIEVQRAGFMVHELTCNVVDRVGAAF